MTNPSAERAPLSPIPHDQFSIELTHSLHLSFDGVCLESSFLHISLFIYFIIQKNQAPDGEPDSCLSTLYFLMNGVVAVCPLVVCKRMRYMPLGKVLTLRVSA